MELPIDRASVPESTTDDPFEKALVAFDREYIQGVRRVRATEVQMHHLVRREEGVPFPLQMAWQALEAALCAVSKLTYEEAPDYTLESDPNDIYNWVWNQIAKFGYEMEARGAEIERSRIGLPHLTPSQAMTVLHCIENCNELLTNHRRSM